MHDITTVNLHRFGDGLLVEVVGEDQQGEVLVRSFELELVDQEAGIVRPRAPLAAGEAPMLEERLGAAGYEMVQEPTPTVS